MFVPVFFLFGVFLLNAKNAYGGYLNIGSHPDSLRFGQATPVEVSGLKEILSASLGYTTKNSLWSGLTVTSAFKYPTAAVIFEVPDGDANISLEGITYELKEDILVEDAFENLHHYVGSRAQRPVHFKSLLVDGLNGASGSISIPVLNHLDKSESLDAEFLRQMSLLPSVASELEESSSVPHGGQDIVLVRVDSLEPLINAYGKSSPKVVEAVSLFRIALAQAIDQLEKLYSGKVLVVTAFTSSESLQTRKTRALLQENPHQAFASIEVPELNFTIPPTIKAAVKDYLDSCHLNDVDTADCVVQHVNLATEYGADYPVIFNIVLFLGIMFFVGLIAITMSLATMDVGKDSIIYRMTNPRMKKD